MPVQVALVHGSTVAGLAVLDSPAIRSSTLPSQYGYMATIQDSINLHEKHAVEGIERIEDEFRKRCSDEHVIASEVVEEGIPVDLILEAATLFDL